jgi:hypothetical protein
VGFANLLLFCTRSVGQWQAIRLHNPETLASECMAASGQLQGGWTQSAQFQPHQPVVWSGSAGTVLSLATSPTDYGEVRAIWGEYQAGIYGAPFGHASLWHGAAASRVDLDPGIPSTFGTEVLAMRGSQQAGEIVTASATHAAVWNGTAASFVDLHPAGALFSFAYATDGQRQGGVASLWINNAGYQHAVLWSGSAGSMVDLNPYPERESLIYGMAPGQQVGWFNPPGSLDMHAGLWSGTAQSLVDLHPFPGVGSSELRATDGSVQVGASQVPGGGSVGGHAGVWFGTAASFVDLHAFLPPGYGWSVATSVYEANGLIYVGGLAGNSSPLHNEAFLWIGVPAPGAMAVLLSFGCVAGRRRRSGRLVGTT